MIIHGVDGWIEISFRSRPNAAQVRALHWLEDDGTLGLEQVGTKVRFPVKAWAAAGEIPSEAASAEETDEWQRRHDEIARLLRINKQQVHVDVQGYLFGSECRLSLVVDGSTVPPDQTSPVLGSTVMLPAVFKAQVELDQARSSWTRDGQIAALGRLKAQLSDASQLLEGSNVPLAVTLHPHIEDVQIRPVKRVALAWKPASGDGGLFSLDLEEIRDDQSRARLPLEKLSAKAGIISISAKDHLLLPDEIAEVAHVAKRNRNQLERNVEHDPTRLLPQGYSYDSVDLSEYGDRVLGFETLQGADRMPAPAAGVAWYQKDADASIPMLTLHLSDTAGASREPVIAVGEVPRLLAEARSALASQDCVIIEGESFPASASLIEQLEGHAQPAELEMPAPNALPPEGGSVVRSGQQAAIIREDRSAQRLPLVAATEVPWATLQTLLQPEIVLREHQRQGVAWLWSHYRSGRAGALLADEMGLGKTLQIGCFLALQATCGRDEDRMRSTLIVCPKILISNWIAEMERYFRPGVLPRTRELRNEWLRSGDADLLEGSTTTFFVISYDAFAKYQRDLLRRHWATAVLDESQNIKNPDTYRTRAARGLKRAFGICSTGTPVENRLRDLWTQFDFLSPGVPFGAPKDFCSEYEGNDDGPSRLRAVLEYPSTSSPVLHREKRDVLQTLRSPHITIHPLPMTREQAQEEARIVATEKEALKILAALQKLYQHPALLRKGAELALTPEAAIEASPKLAACIRILRGVQEAGEKALIFTLWSQMQELLRTAIHHAFGLFPVNVVNGASNQSGQSQKMLKAFASREGFNVLIMSPLAAGAGLNVTAANHVIHYGRWWNPAKEDQATARAHRIGQTRDVHVHYLVLHHPDDRAQGFDTKLHDYVTQKRDLAADFLAPTDDRGLETFVASSRRSVAQ